MRQADNVAAIGMSAQTANWPADQARMAMRDAAISYFAGEGLEYTERDITGYVNEAYFECGHDIGEI